MRLLRSREDKQAAEGARGEYERFLALLHYGTPEQVRSEAVALRESGVASALSSRERNRLGMKAVSGYADAVLADEVPAQDEEDTFFQVCEAVGMEDEDWQRDRDLLFRLAIAKANDGRLSEIDDPHGDGEEERSRAPRDGRRINEGSDPA